MAEFGARALPFRLFGLLDADKLPEGWGRAAARMVLRDTGNADEPMSHSRLYQMNTRASLHELSRVLKRRATLDDVTGASLDRF
jgi:hypothetical protein